MPCRACPPPLFGSGTEGPADPLSGLINTVGSVLFAPLTIAESVIKSMSGPATQGESGWGARRFAPHGEVVPTTSSRQLKQRNIFGAGGK
jgi:hypothetical protein